MTIKERYEKFLTDMKTLFSNTVPKEEQEALSAFIKLADMPTAPTAKEYKTKDGKVLTCSGELAVGADVMLDGKPAPDADYVLEDESTIKVSGGKVAEIMPKKEQPVEGDMAKQVAQLTANLSSQETLIKSYEAKFSGQEKEITEMKKQVVLLSKTIEKILSTPVNMGEEKPKVKKNVEDMTNREKVLHNRGVEIFE